jgi:Trk-type K+ transport system membrane component
MLIALNGTDWAFFELLNIGNPATDAIAPRSRVLDGLFQAIAVRSGGFYIVSIPQLRIGLQVLYVIMMYISVYPVVITMRHSNVYEERSLGIYAAETHLYSQYHLPVSDDERDQTPSFAQKLKRALTAQFPTSLSQTNTAFLHQQIRGQLAHDLWWLALAIFVITCIEVGNFDRDPVTYSVFNVIFEVVSGYGCVGISTGLPDQDYSFSGGWHTCSKLVLICVMLRGRHRGLPVALDRAVRLPGGRDDGDEVDAGDEEETMREREEKSNMTDLEGFRRRNVSSTAV